MQLVAGALSTAARKAPAAGLTNPSSAAVSVPKTALAVLAFLSNEN
jgi:hypothetical protein